MPNDIINNTQDLEVKKDIEETPTPVVTPTIEQTTDTTTIAPAVEVKQEEAMYSSPIYHPTYTAELKEEIPGATVERKDKDVPLFHKNTSYLNILVNNIDVENVNIATTAFQASGTLPKINGKTIELGEFSTAMKDPASRKLIMDQASEITKDPSLDLDTQLKLLESNMNVVEMTGQLAGQSKKFWKSVYDQSISTDLRLGSDWSSRHKLMFKKDLSGFVSPDEYALLLANSKNHSFNEEVDKARIREYTKNPDTWFPPVPKDGVKKVDNSYVDKIEKFLNKEGYKNDNPIFNYIRYGRNSNDINPTVLKNTSDKLFDKFKTTVLGIRQPNPYAVDMGREASESTAAGVYFDTPLGPQGIPGGRRSLATTNAIPPVHWDNIIANYQYRPDFTAKNIKTSSEYKRNLELYELNKANIIQDYNESNSRHAFDIRADLQQKFTKNKGGETQSIAGTINFDNNSPTMAYKGKKIESPEHTDFLNLNNIIQAQLGINSKSKVYDRGIKIQFGKISGENPEDIETTDPQLKDFFTLLNDDIYKGHRLNSDLHPKGTITFVSAAGGSNDYHAYNIKFDRKYLNHQKFVGAENKGIIKLHPELLTEGITIYIPNKTSEEVTKLARNSKEATKISTTEGLFTLENKLNFLYPGAGNLNLELDKDSGQIIASGWLGRFNPINGKVDTVKMDVQRYPFNQMLVLDTLIGNWKDRVKMNFKSNYDSKLEYNKLNGAIHDPNQLKNQ